MTDTTPLNVTPTPPLSPMALAARRFRKHRMAIFGLVLLVLLVLYVGFAGMLSRGSCAPIKQSVSGEAWANCNDPSLKLQPPSAQHIFGTDVIGRDIFARTIYGGQISLLIGISAAIVEVILAAVIGALAAYYGGWVDMVMLSGRQKRGTWGRGLSAWNVAAIPQLNRQQPKLLTEKYGGMCGNVLSAQRRINRPTWSTQSTSWNLFGWKTC